jgi:hypothetical protein
MCNLHCSFVVPACIASSYRSFVSYEEGISNDIPRPYGLVLSLGMAINNLRYMNSHDGRSQSDRLN